MDQDIKPPSRLYTLSEGFRAAAELLSFQRLFFSSLLENESPVHGKNPVIVLPGFLLSDLSTAPLRKFLTKLGYPTYGWGPKRNMGPSPKTLKYIEAHLAKIYEQHGGQRVTLIGHSLGGIYATELSRKYPHMVANVIKLGSPAEGMLDSDGINPLILKIFDVYNPTRKSSLIPDFLANQIPDSSSVPVLSIYSKTDGIVNWRACIDSRAQNVEVAGSHCGLAFNRQVADLISNELARHNEKPKACMAEPLKMSA